MNFAILIRPSLFSTLASSNKKSFVSVIEFGTFCLGLENEIILFWNENLDYKYECMRRAAQIDNSINMKIVPTSLCFDYLPNSKEIARSLL